MKNLILTIALFIMSMGAFAQGGNTSSQRSDFAEFSNFIQAFRIAFHGENHELQKQYVYTPFQYDIVGIVLEKADWDTILVHYYLLFQDIAYDMPAILTPDYTLETEDYSMDVSYSDEDDAYVVHYSYYDEDFSEEYIYAKKIDGMFQFYRYSYFDLSIFDI